MLKRFAFGLCAICLLGVAAIGQAQEGQAQEGQAQEGQAQEDLGEALREASSVGDVETVKQLLKKGADPNAANRYGATALISATNKEHFEVVKVLIASGADVNQEDKFYGFGPLGAAFFGDNEEIPIYMIEHGNLKDADAVLPMAINSGSIEIVEALLKTGKLTDAGLSSGLVAAQQIQSNLSSTEESTDETAESLKNIAEVLARLEKAGAKLPPPSDFQLPPEALARFAGTYVWPEQQIEGLFVVEDKNLTAKLGGGPPQKLEPIDATSFRPQGQAPFTIHFQVDGDRVSGFQLKQEGGQVFDFVVKPAEGAAGAAETAEAKKKEEEKVTETQPEAVIPPGGATRDWPAFRGANADGTAAGNPPVEWSVEKGENVLWKTPVPGQAHASPIIWGDRMFIATAVKVGGEADEIRLDVGGDVEAVEIEHDYVWRLYALDKTSGEIVWERTAAEGRPRSAHHLIATQANPTPVTDGKHVVTVMGSEGIYCYDFDGKLLWKKDLGTLHVGWFYDPSYQWGHSSSPILHDGKVIVQVDRHGDAFIAAFDVESGKELWRTERDNMPSWGTPAVLEANGRIEVVTNGTQHIRAYDPKTGKELWNLGPNSEITVGTPVVGHGLVYVVGGYSPVRPIYAIRPGGKGDISVAEGEESNEHVAWKHDNGGTYMPSPLVYGDHLYTLSNNGVLACYDAKTGERLYRARVAGRGGQQFIASPVAAHGRIYTVSTDGHVYVGTAGTKYEILATNPMDETVMASPAISGDVLYVRSLGHVFAIGKAASTEDSAASP